jgi:hypothetical protein
MLRQNRLNCFIFERSNRGLFRLRVDVGILLEHLIADVLGQRPMVCSETLGLSARRVTKVCLRSCQRYDTPVRFSLFGMRLMATSVSRRRARSASLATVLLLLFDDSRITRPANMNLYPQISEAFPSPLADRMRARKRSNPPAGRDNGRGLLGTTRLARSSRGVSSL